MRLKVFTLIAAAGLIAAAAIPAIAAPGDVALEAKRMTGKQEVPEKGDDDGKGHAHVTLKPKKEKLCFQIEFEDIEDPNEGHIHKGLKGDDGPIKVELFDSSSSSPVEDCVSVEEPQLDKLEQNPERFYVNLHNDDYPDGAIRGQLALEEEPK